MRCWSSWSDDLDAPAADPRRGGTQQALIVVVLSGQAPDSVLLSFSVGMQFITLANAARVHRARADAPQPVPPQGDPRCAGPPRLGLATERVLIEGS